MVIRDVRSHIHHGVFPCRIDTPPLEVAEEALSWRVVPVIAFAAHRAHQAQLFRLAPVPFSCAAFSRLSYLALAGSFIVLARCPGELGHFTLSVGRPCG